MMRLWGRRRGGRGRLLVLRVSVRVCGGDGRELTGGCLAVAAGDFVDDADGVVVFAFAHEVLGGFVDGEAEEADEEHDHGQAAHADDEVAPAHVLAPRALFAFLARVVSEQRPCHERCNDLRDGPVY